MIIKTSYPFMKPPPSARLIRGNRLAQGLIGYWLMNEGAGDKVFDLSGNGNIGTFVNGPIWAAGKFGSAVSFSGTNDQRISVPFTRGTSPLISETLVVWVKPIGVNTANDNQGILTIAQYDKSANARLSFATDGVTPSVYSTLSVASASFVGSALSLGVWYQIVGVFDATSATTMIASLYVNGVFVGSDTGSGDYFYAADSILFGISKGYYDRVLKGYIDHGLVYNRALSASEIAQLYREPFCMFERKARTALMMPSVGAPPVGIPILRRRREAC